MGTAKMKKGFPVCRSCGTLMTDFDGVFWYSCPECGNSVRIADGIVTWQNEIGKSNSFIKCSNCGENLSGSEYTAPWENGNNPDGYYRCRHCGAINFEGFGD